jgi:hypothetical protein
LQKKFRRDHLVSAITLLVFSLVVLADKGDAQDARDNLLAMEALIPKVHE